MVYITHNGENAEKITEILVAAQRRFGMYGLEKTTMTEIAADLNMSKGSIYYYFPDKEKLYMAVVENEHSVFIQKVSDKIETMESPADMIKEYILVNLQYFRTLLNLSRVKLSEVNSNHCTIKLLQQCRVKEKQILINILQKGINSQMFHISNPEEIAELFLDLLKGLRKSIIGQKELFYLEKEEYDMLAKKVNQFAEIFINGIMYLKH